MQFVDQIFWIAAIAGSVFMVITAFTGFVGHSVVHGGGHHGGHVSHGHAEHGHAQGHSQTHGHGQAHHATHSGFDWGQLSSFLMTYLNPTFLAVSLAFFGIIGVFTRSFGVAANTSLSLAIVLGTALAVLSMRSVIGLISRGGQSSHVVTREIVGRVAEVTTSIPTQGYGEVTIYTGGSRLCFPARSADEVAKGLRVLVERIENGVATVSKYDE